MTRFVTLDVADAIGTIRLARPPMNALDIAMQDQLREVAQEATERSDVRAVVIWGGEKVFAAGADIKEMQRMTYTDMVARGGALQEAFTAVARIPKPVVAAVTGYALGGGCELALCADIRIVAENAKLGQPEILLGLIPGAAAPAPGPAGRPGQGQGADLHGPSGPRRGGAADRPGRPGGPGRGGLPGRPGLGGKLATGPAWALRAAKEAVDRGLESDLDTGLALERSLFAGLFATEDREIGMRSFVEEGPGKAKFN